MVVPMVAGSYLGFVLVMILNALIKKCGFVFVDLSWSEFVFVILYPVNLCCDLVFDRGSHARKLVALRWYVGF